ncbi:hypothetical protein LEP1GSC104_3747 [Leptospira interrogans str. UI 12621]|uniref:Uncharacterized protein n=1 Tax=Leptospira interrogans str. UI 12621 TaxID=1049937 RepID=A0A0F6HAP5_LEPIR|nr:hypothetical protein LEP1GSC104_3747 [Leptospira interrogans str. UI 12621]
MSQKLKEILHVILWKFLIKYSILYFCETQCIASMVALQVTFGNL